MTDNKNTPDEPKKLSLTNSKLTLNRPVNLGNLKQSFINNRTNTITVEVKRGIAHRSRKMISLEENNDSLTNEEVNKRLTLLRRAAEANKEQESERAPLVIEPEIAEITAVKEENSDLTLTLANLKAIRENAPVALPTYVTNRTKEITSPVKPAEAKPAETKLTEAKIESKNFINTKINQNVNLIISDNEDDNTQKRGADTKIIAKAKKEEPKKLKKTEIFHMLDSDEESSAKKRSLASIKRAKEKERRKAMDSKVEKLYREVVIPEAITVGELASRMSERAADVIKELMKLGMIVTANQTIDADTAELIVSTMGHTPKRVQESDIENVLAIPDDNSADLKSRAPVVTIMGHVDHGKTSLLDALKSTDVATGEAGGITQHIGAYRVNLSSGQSITFLDTPGHEAFTAMRSRGAKITDIVVLVVAADDGIMTQTVEAINHAKAAHIPIIVAVNKIDKPDANIDRVKNGLLMHELIAEDLGGDVMIIPISALKKQGLDKLEEAILLVAEMAELKANYNATASGTVIEAKIDRGKGVIATVLVQRGTLKVGDLMVAGESYGKVKKIINDRETNLIECIPSMPVEIWGLNQVPMAGDNFAVVQNEKQARDITEYRARQSTAKKLVHTQRSHSLENLFAKAIGEGKQKELPIILKCDVQGSIEAIATSLHKILSDEVKIRILHTAVGGITDSDITLASATNALILGFNVRASNTAAIALEKAGIDIRYYSIIYNLLDDVKAIMSGMLSPIIREEYIGSVEIRQVFNITKVGKIAGSYVTKGIIRRGAGVRLLRDNIVIHEGKLKTLKRFTEDVKEVKENYECGIAFENYEDIKVGDRIEVFEIIEEKQKL